MTDSVIADLLETNTPMDFKEVMENINYRGVKINGGVLVK